MVYSPNENMNKKTAKKAPKPKKEELNPHTPIVIGMRPWEKSDDEACERLWAEHSQTLRRVEEKLERDRVHNIISSVWTPEQVPILLQSLLEAIKAFREFSVFISHASQRISQKSS